MIIQYPRILSFFYFYDYCKKVGVSYPSWATVYNRYLTSFFRKFKALVLVLKRFDHFPTCVAPQSLTIVEKRKYELLLAACYKWYGSP